MSAPSTRLRSPNLDESLHSSRAKLEEERVVLLAQSVVMAEELRAFPTVVDRQDVDALVAATHAALAEVEDALARLDSGD